MDDMFDKAVKHAQRIVDAGLRPSSKGLIPQRGKESTATYSWVCKCGYKQSITHSQCASCGGTDSDQIKAMREGK